MQLSRHYKAMHRLAEIEF